MKKIFFLMIALSFAVSACGTSASPSVPAGAAIQPSPISQVDLQATAAIMAQQTIQAMPTATLPPTNTPVVETKTPTIMPSATINATATATQNPILLTLTATLGTGTPFALGTISATSASGTAQPTAQTTATLATSGGPTTDPTYPQTYGTMPPALPAGKVVILNQTKDQAYVSLHTTSKDGYASIVEYSVNGKQKINAKVPAGNGNAVVWVGGQRYSAEFRLRAGETVVVTITSKGVTAK